MKRKLAVALLVVSGCGATTHLESSTPVATAYSAKSRAAVSDCLLNRLGSSGFRPDIAQAGGTTTLRLTSVDQWSNPGLYLFVIRDQGAGSLIEVRIPHGFVKRGLPLAETCF